MSLFVKVLCGGENVKMKSCQQDGAEKFPEGEELLLKKEEFLKNKIEQEFLFAKKNCRTNRRVALQALRRKKWYEKQLMYVDCAVKAVRSAHEHIDIVNKVNDLIKDITEEQDVAQDMLDTFYTSVSFGVEFDEDELLAELERLEKNLDEILSEDRTEDKALCPQVSPTASPPHPAKTEEDEVEDELEYLRRWANETL